MSLNKLLIFGTGYMAEYAFYYFSRENEWDVIGFAVDSEYMQEEKFCNKPVVSTEELEALKTEQCFHMFVAIGYSGLNEVRKEKFNYFSQRGYKFANYISRDAKIHTARMGVNLFVGEGSYVQRGSTLGNNIIVISTALIGHDVNIDDHVCISNGVIVGGQTMVGERCFLGNGVNIAPKVTIGAGCYIGASAYVNKSLSDDTVVMGIPAPKGKIDRQRFLEIQGI